MKRIVFIIAAMLCLLGSVATAQTVKQKVAVYVTGDAETGYKKVIGSKLVTGITRSEDYAAVERTADFLAEMAKEQDYQMSGAVNDSQIARLGQQFGVRYVFVADISEVFESIFVSARMIDVQTAQIINSTEASKVVSNMESLSKLAEDIVLAIFGDPDFAKLQGPYTNFDNLYSCNAPSGYHIATEKEIKTLIKNYQMMGKKLSFPIYADIHKDIQFLRQIYTVECYTNNTTSKVKKTFSLNHSYQLIELTCTLIENVHKSSTLNLSYTDDSDYQRNYNISNKPARPGQYKFVSRGLTYMGTAKPSITPGYVYMIKNKEN